MTWELRRAGIPTEFYVGIAKGPGKQLKYADQYEIPIVLLYGSNEKEKGEVTIKDMTVGREKAKAVGDRKEWLAARPGQKVVKRSELADHRATGAHRARSGLARRTRSCNQRARAKKRRADRAHRRELQESLGIRQRGSERVRRHHRLR